MFRSNAEVRTVWVKDLVTEKRQGPNGEFDAKSILFRVASNRNYTRTVLKDGQQVEEYPTDFILCRANGKTAEVIANNCKAVDETGKPISRHLNIYGHIETFVQDRTFKVENLPVGINGQTYNLTFDTTQKVDGHIFIVDEVEFLDPKPQPKVVASNGATVSNVQVQPANVATTTTTDNANVAVNAQPAQVAVQPQATEQTTTVAPQPAQPQATVAQTVVAGMMNPPTVPEGYTGEHCAW